MYFSMLGIVFANKIHLAAVICSRKKFNLLHLSSCRLQACKIMDKNICQDNNKLKALHMF